MNTFLLSFHIFLEIEEKKLPNVFLFLYLDCAHIKVVDLK